MPRTPDRRVSVPRQVRRSKWPARSTPPGRVFLGRFFGEKKKRGGKREQEATFRRVFGETEMTTDPKRKSPQNDSDQRKRLELELDNALQNTFPASDPVSIEQPKPPEPKGGRS